MARHRVAWRGQAGQRGRCAERAAARLAAHTMCTALRNFAVGILAVGKFAVGNFCHKEILPKECLR